MNALLDYPAAERAAYAEAERRAAAMAALVRYAQENGRDWELSAAKMERLMRSLLLAQMVEMHAFENWGKDGWDWIYECRGIEDMAEEIDEEGITTIDAAIAHFGETAQLLRDREEDCGGGDEEEDWE